MMPPSPTPTSSRSGRAFSTVSGTPKTPVHAYLDGGRLAALVETQQLSLVALRDFEAFILTVWREWGGVDPFRIDKFYLLICKFLWHAFLLMRKNAWDPNLVGRVVGILSGKSLLATNDSLAIGVNCHASVGGFLGPLDEMKNHLPLADDTVDFMLKPFTLLLQKSSDEVLVDKVKVNMFERLLENGRKLLNLMKDGAQVELMVKRRNLGRLLCCYYFQRSF